MTLSLNHGATRIRGHCSFSWTEPVGTGRRVFEVELRHCDRCIAELRRGFPDADVSGGPAILPEGSVPLPTQESAELVAGVGGLVLVVDDDPDTRESTRELLERARYRTLLASHGKEALRLLVNGAHPNLILLDLAMPEMGGWQFLTLVRANARMARIPVVIVTGQSSEDNQPAFTQCLRKPVAPDTLLRAVKQSISLPR